MVVSANVDRAADAPWQELSVAGWAQTKATLHLYAQMLGKIRAALSPPQPNWLHTALYLTPRGFTTSAIPCGDRTLEVVLDVFRSELVFTKSDGRAQVIPLLPVRTIAAVYANVLTTLRALDVVCVLSSLPQEIADQTPLHDDHRPREYDAAAVGRWFATYTATAAVFERRRAQFFGRSGVQLWWGAFDIALLFFSGKHVAPPQNRGYLMRYDLDAELLNVGLYLGDEQNAPFFYGYLHPEPPHAERALSTIEGASWSQTLHEWVLPYDAVRTARDPEARIVAFIDAIYAVAVTDAGWNRVDYVYDAPKPRS